MDPSGHWSLSIASLSILYCLLEAGAMDGGFGGCQFSGGGVNTKGHPNQEVF
jgi:hypothetical protein